VLTKGEQAEILAAIRDEPFRQSVWAMLETGARSSEVARVPAGDVYFDLGVWVFGKHETAKKPRKARVVYRCGLKYLRRQARTVGESGAGRSPAGILLCP
jgi:hypothetical protein